MPEIHELDASGNVVSTGVVNDQSGYSGTSFWGVEVHPGNVASSMCPPKGALIHITHATLGHRLHHKKAEDSGAEQKEDRPAHAPARCLVTASASGTKTVICSLREGVCENVPLNLLFDSVVAFTVSGQCSVFLSGYTEPYDPNTLGGDDDEEEDAEAEEFDHPLSFLMNGGDDDDEDVEDEDDEDFEDEEEEEEEQQVVKANGKRAALTAPEPAQKAQQENKNKKQKVPEKAAKPAPAEKKEQDKKQPAQKKQEQKEKQQPSPAKGKEAPQTPRGKETPAKAKEAPQTPKGKETPAKASTPQQSPRQDEKPKPVRLPNGLIYHDLLVGKGPTATRGRSVSMRYRGTLAKNGREFDSNMPRGRPFVFRIGDGDVIKGWDVGIPGMKVGGKRRLTIPSELAYGRRGAPPDIPPNADLVFDVELLGIK